jgi:hypothetical protein
MSGSDALPGDFGSLGIWSGMGTPHSILRGLENYLYPRSKMESPYWIHCLKVIVKWFLVFGKRGGFVVTGRLR